MKEMQRQKKNVWIFHEKCMFQTVEKEKKKMIQDAFGGCMRHIGLSTDAACKPSSGFIGRYDHVTRYEVQQGRLRAGGSRRMDQSPVRV